MFVNSNTVKMRILLNSAIAALALGILLTYSGCDNGGGVEPTVEEVQLEKLNGTWTMAGSGTNVTLNGVSQKSDYTGFKLNLTGTAGAASFNYTTEGRPAKLSPWPSSGTWKFGAVPESGVIRDPGTEDLNISYTVSDTQLELTFTYNGAGFSRTKQVTGTWVFTMSK